MHLFFDEYLFRMCLAIGNLTRTKYSIRNTLFCYFSLKREMFLALCLMLFLNYLLKNVSWQLKELPLLSFIYIYRKQKIEFLMLFFKKCAFSSLFTYIYPSTRSRSQFFSSLMLPSLQSFCTSSNIWLHLNMNSFREFETSPNVEKRSNADKPEFVSPLCVLYSDIFLSHITHSVQV